MGPLGPERRATAGVEHRGQEGQRGQHREHDADRGDRAECAVGLEIAQQQAQEAGDDGAPRGEDRLDRPADRRPRRRPRAPLRAQRLAESRDVEQRVVRGRADDEDEEDALRLSAEQDDVVVREPPHGEERDAEREHRRREHDDRQQERTVDDDEDDEHRDERHREQQAVDPGESGGEICGEAGGTGDVHGDAVAHLCPELIPELGNHLADIRTLVDRHEGLGGEPVLGGDGRGHVIGHSGDRGGAVDGVLDRLELGISELRVTDEHDDRGDRIAVGEFPQPLLHAGGIGGFGEEVRLLVGRHLIDLAEVRPPEAGAGDPEDDEDGGEQDPQPRGHTSRHGGGLPKDLSSLVSNKPNMRMTGRIPI